MRVGNLPYEKTCIPEKVLEVSCTLVLLIPSGHFAGSDSPF
jgi:hypothetical protein